ncbi:MAG TPA: hypothetical protein VMW37_04775 [Dehalococcoidales bacterium]|nr:hypothetical protein [Dehalococcoidales bacterium]
MRLPRYAGNDTLPCLCEAGEASRSNLSGDRGLPRFARNDKKGEARNDIMSGRSLSPPCPRIG